MTSTPLRSLVLLASSTFRLSTVVPPPTVTVPVVVVVVVVVAIYSLLKLLNLNSYKARRLASARSGHGKDFSVVRRVVSLEIGNARINECAFVTCGHTAPAMKRLPRQRTGKCLVAMTARRRRQCPIRNFADRWPGRQAQLKDQKVD